jgi:hypothetical protein
LIGADLGDDGLTEGPLGGFDDSFYNIAGEFVAREVCEVILEDLQ